MGFCAILLSATLLTFGCQREDSTDTPGDAAEMPAVDTSPLNGAGYNVLLISVDTTRADHLGCYGHPIVKTPNIDRFAAEGTRFEQCASSAPLTLPSHSTMLTGSYPFVHGARDNGIFKLAPENTTLAELFQAAGYATHAEVAAMVLGLRYGLNQGFDTYGEVPRVEQKPKLITMREQQGDAALEESSDPEIKPDDPVAEVDRKADEITRRGIELLAAKAKAKERFFIFLHYFDPHWPHEAPERFAIQYPEGYFAEIAFFDEQFGKLIDAVRELELDKNTLVVFTADHGEGRGEHGEFTHSTFLYDSTLHVPLVIWCPGKVPPGQVVTSQVRLVDIAPTVVAFTGLERTPQMEGTSLLPLLVDPHAGLRLPCYSETMVPQNALKYSPLRSLRVDGWKYVLAPRPELYDLTEDPKELFNLASVEAERAAGMREELRSIIANAPAPAAGRGTLVAVDEGEMRKLAALGYVSTAMDETELQTGSELDHFEPVGVNPRDRIEVVELWATGMGAFQAGEYKDAERMYRRFIELEPDLADAQSYLARSLAMLDREDEAIPFFRRAVELEPERFQDQRALGNRLAAKGEYDEAMEHFRQAIEYNPEELIARVNLGVVLTSQGHPEEAIPLFDEALKIVPDGANPPSERSRTSGVGANRGSKGVDL